MYKNINNNVSSLKVTWTSKIKQSSNSESPAVPVKPTWNEKMLALWKESYVKSRQCIKKPRHHCANKGPYSQSYGFSSSYVQMWELDHKEVWAPENWSFRIMVLEKTFENLLDCREIKPANPKGNKPWIFIRKTDAEAEAPILWPPDVKSQLIGKRPWCWERLKAKGKEEGRGWDGWMASLTQWPRVWASSNFHYLENRGKPGVRQSMRSQKVRHNWATVQQQSLLLAHEWPWALCLMSMRPSFLIFN